MTIYKDIFKKVEKKEEKKIVGLFADIGPTSQQKPNFFAPEKKEEVKNIQPKENMFDIGNQNTIKNDNKKEENKQQDENKDKKKLQSTIRQNKNNYNFSSNARCKGSEYTNGENKDYLNKKRKGIPKIYQNVINKQQMNSGINQTPNKENNNILNNEFSNFEI